jgi:hypothetical protein
VVRGIIESRRLGWAGHVARVMEKRYACNGFAEEPGGMGLKMHIKFINSETFIARDRALISILHSI